LQTFRYRSNDRAPTGTEEEEEEEKEEEEEEENSIFSKLSAPVDSHSES
jgi:hypothetical protein